MSTETMTVLEPPRASAVLVLLLTLIFALSAASTLSLLDERQTEERLSRLEVSGSFRHVRPEAVRAAVLVQLRTNLYNVDLDAVRAKVAALPWVQRVRVERVWPGSVRVQIWEYEPYARWGKDALLAADGTMFVPPASQLPQGLPLLAGPKGHEPEVMRAYTELALRMKDTPFALASLALDDRGEWSATTTGGIELRLGQGNPADRAALIAATVTQTLATRLQDVRYVDLRYTNGFAVGWRGIDAPAGENSHE